jgi:hypothetical protein
MDIVLGISGFELDEFLENGVKGHLRYAFEFYEEQGVTIDQINFFFASSKIPVTFISSDNSSCVQ